MALVIALIVEMAFFNHRQSMDLSAVGAPLVEAAKGSVPAHRMMTGRRHRRTQLAYRCLVFRRPCGRRLRLDRGHLLRYQRRTWAASVVTAAIRLVMGPFAHSLFTSFFGIGVYFALQQQRPAKWGWILLGYLGAVLVHALWNGSTLLGAGYYFRRVRAVVGADVRGDDHPGRLQPAP